MKKKLFKSHNKMICGVCSGLAEMFDIDPTLIRLGTVVLTVICFGLGIIGYIVAAIIIPDAPNDNIEQQNNSN